ncbi:MAG: hypothetical protein NXI32_23095 [bacterium]|nr:hypothetical protein [bacterium]
MKSSGTTASSEPPILEQRICGRCGAWVDAGRKQCWMCHADASLFQHPATAGQALNNPYASGPTASGPPVTKTARPYNDQYDAIFTALLIGCLVLAILVGIGMASEDPGALVAYLILIGPAFLVTGVKALWQVGQHGKPQPGKLLVNLFVSFAVTIAVISLLALAAVILLFFVCIWHISNL